MYFTTALLDWVSLFCGTGDRALLRRYFKIITLSLLNHVSPFVRGSVLRFVATLYPEQSLPILLRSLNDSDAIVRENAVDELGDLGDESAISPLKVLFENEKDQNVREAIETALEMLLV